MGRRVVGGIAIGVAAAAAGAAAVAAAALSVIVARTVIIPPSRRTEDVTILGLDPVAGTILLSSNADSRLPGDYSFWFTRDTGHARLGEIIEQDERTVLRRVHRRRLRRPRRGAARAAQRLVRPEPARPAVPVPRRQRRDAARSRARLADPRRGRHRHALGDQRARSRRAPLGDAARDRRRSTPPGTPRSIASYRNDGDAPAQRRLPLRARRPRVAGHRGGDAVRARPRRRQSWC